MKKKKFLVTFCALSLLLSVGNTVFAATTNTNKSVNTGLISDTVKTKEQQLAALDSSNLTDEQKEIAIKKLNITGSSSDTLTATTTTTTTWKYLDSFTIWKQEQKYYCAPASAKAAMYYLTGKSDSQSTIAKDMGTTASGTPFSAVQTYLNNKQGRNVYVTKSSDTSLSDMEACFYSDVATYDAPPLIGVVFSTSGGWAYSTSGHMMPICGARSDKVYFQLADPYIQWVDSSASMKYTKSATVIQKAVYNGAGFIF